MTDENLMSGFVFTARASLLPYKVCFFPQFINDDISNKSKNINQFDPNSQNRSNVRVQSLRKEAGLELELEAS